MGDGAIRKNDVAQVGRLDFNSMDAQLVQHLGAESAVVGLDLFKPICPSHKLIQLIFQIPLLLKISSIAKHLNYSGFAFESHQ